MCVNKSLTIFARGHPRFNRLLTVEAFDIATTMRVRAGGPPPSIAASRPRASFRDDAPRARTRVAIR
jgi:hypothetical protein